MDHFDNVWSSINSWDKESLAIVCDNTRYSYNNLINKVYYYVNFLNQEVNDLQGKIVAIKSSMSFDSICLFFALCKCKCIVVPVSENSFKNIEFYCDKANADYIIDLTNKHVILIKRTDLSKKHEYLNKIREKNKSGLIVFSSGSSGKPKGAVHDIDYIFEKFIKPRRKLKTLSFLLFDHLGGINTFIYVLSSGGCLVIPENKTVNKVLKTVEEFKVELLPTSPSFLNLMLASELYEKYDLSCLKIISYGTEMMHEKVLQKLNKTFENVTLQQTYGLTEIGVLRSKSLSNDSLWVKLGGKEFKTRVVDGKLQIKGKSTMLGYLNAENPFTEDGWLKTGDNVEVDGDYYKILGRDTDIIIVGGQKVYPAEVENIILDMKEVKDVTVFSEKNSLIGSIVCAKIVPKDLGVSHKRLRSDIKKYCSNRMEKFKIPVKILFVDSLVSNRYKKVRS